nr:ubiquitin carboxyl-terminal hydrolase 13-like isoform X1 [Tanacetum cinerariifolium]
MSVGKILVVLGMLNESFIRLFNIMWNTSRSLAWFRPELFSSMVHLVVQVQDFSEPFFLKTREGETFAEVKVQIHKKLHIPPKKFSKAPLSFTQMHSL